MIVVAWIAVVVGYIGLGVSAALWVNRLDGAFWDDGVWGSAVFFWPLLLLVAAVVWMAGWLPRFGRRG